MRVVELFAGAGGAALGLDAAGFEHLACIEWDADACATLRAVGLPAVEGDVGDLDLYEPEWVGCDLLWSSFPCQCWSSAGDRLGPKDERNGWPWTVNAIDRLKPRWFAAENVTGLLQHKRACEEGCLGPDLCPRAYFDRVILVQLRERFESVQCRVINASSFGVPQHRRRVVVVAGPGPLRWPEPTHGKPTSQADLFGRDLLPWVSAARAAALEGAITHLRSEQVGAPSWPATVPAPTVGTSGNVYAHRGDPGTRPQPNKQKAFDQELVPPTDRRRLTAIECAALQGFPPEHPWSGGNRSKYRQIGNAVPPKLAEVVGRAIMRAQKENER